ncbi:MAG: translation initiation factor IF-2, partial [Chloroflexi bacterium]|nr:translation initiation factor IF-2 [Chloroflexota bacterium]
MAEQSEGPVTATRKVTLRALRLGDAITVGTLAERMGVDPVLIIKQLMRTGVFASINQVVDYDTAAAIARPFGYVARRAADNVSVAAGAVAEDESANLSPRPPIVTILGHVDHGKTTLLDSIRNSNLVDKEVGGITQHIGAYQVDRNGFSITFIDTPGHAAFTAMRARGAQVTDIAVLVVAADDGVMPQTLEAIDHIKAAGVPIVVAINKMDTAGADPEKVRRQLSEHELVVEKWGGDVIDVEVSAKSGDGLDDLLDNIQLVAEVAELKANPTRPGVGVVVESRLDKSRGVLATVLVQTGTLKVGDYLVVGAVRGRVKALFGDAGKRVDAAGPSTPIEVLGLNDLPAAGDRLVVVADEKTARDTVAEVLRRQTLQKTRGTSLEEIGSRVSTGEAKELALVVKTDVHGSMEAVRHALEQLSTPETQVRIIHAATGAVTESDILLAVASNAIIIGFNTSSDQGAQRLDAQGFASLVPGVELTEQRLGGGDGVGRIALRGHRRAEGGQDAVAEKLVDAAAVTLDDRHHERLIFGQQGHHMVGGQTMGEGGEAANIEAQDRRVAGLALAGADQSFGRRDPRGDLGREEPRQIAHR